MLAPKEAFRASLSALRAHSTADEHWIWRGSEQAADPMALRDEWLTCRASLDRAREERSTLRIEKGRTVRFFQHQVRWRRWL